MPTLAERRKMLEAAGGAGASGDFIKWTQEGETKILRFLFDDANSIESHRVFWDPDTKQRIVDGDQGTYRIVFNCVEYDRGGANPRRVRWDISEYLYNEYLSPYIEKDTPARNHVWEIKVRRPKSMDLSFICFEVTNATLDKYPIPEGGTTTSTGASQPNTPTYAAPAQSAAPVQQEAPAQPQPAPAPAAAPQPQQPAPASTTTRRPNKYFD